MTGLKKNVIKLYPCNRQSLVELSLPSITIGRQAELLGISRSSIYSCPVVNMIDIDIMHAIDEIFTKCPFYGKRRICIELQKQGIAIGIKKTRSLMQKMGLETIYQKPKTSISHPDHQKYPYLLRGIDITAPNHVWATDITYIRMPQGFIYLIAIIDWYSRFILTWDISITLEATFCITALESALRKYTHPSIFNSDQGVQYTSVGFTNILLSNGIAISMDSRGRCYDNIFIERLWRTIKYEEVYLKQYQSVSEARQNLKEYIYFYNYERPHQSFNYKTPAELYFQSPSNISS